MTKEIIIKHLLENAIKQGATLEQIKDLEARYIGMSHLEVQNIFAINFC